MRGTLLQPPAAALVKVSAAVQAQPSALGAGAARAQRVWQAALVVGEGEAAPHLPAVEVLRPAVLVHVWVLFKTRLSIKPRSRCLLRQLEWASGHLRRTPGAHTVRHRAMMVAAWGPGQASGQAAAAEWG